MSHCVQIIVDHPQKRDGHTHTEKECVCNICVCVCLINCQEESLAAWGSGQSSVVVLAGGLVSGHCLPPGCHLGRHQFSSSATTGMGENSPTLYALQGSLKAWVNFHPGCMESNLRFFSYYFKKWYFTNIHNLQQAQGETRSWQSWNFLFVTQIFIA